MIIGRQLGYSDIEIDVTSGVGSSRKGWSDVQAAQPDVGKQFVWWEVVAGNRDFRPRRTGAFGWRETRLYRGKR